MAAGTYGWSRGVPFGFASYVRMRISTCALERGKSSRYPVDGHALNRTARKVGEGGLVVRSGALPDIASGTGLHLDFERSATSAVAPSRPENLAQASQSDNLWVCFLLLGGNLYGERWSVPSYGHCTQLDPAPFPEPRYHQH